MSARSFLRPSFVIAALLALAALGGGCDGDADDAAVAQEVVLIELRV